MWYDDITLSLFSVTEPWSLRGVGELSITHGYNTDLLLTVSRLNIRESNDVGFPNLRHFSAIVCRNPKLSLEQGTRAASSPQFWSHCDGACHRGARAVSLLVSLSSSKFIKRKRRSRGSCETRLLLSSAAEFTAVPLPALPSQREEEEEDDHNIPYCKMSFLHCPQ